MRGTQLEAIEAHGKHHLLDVNIYVVGEDADRYALLAKDYQEMLIEDIKLNSAIIIDMLKYIYSVGQIEGLLHGISGYGQVWVLTKDWEALDEISDSADVVPFGSWILFEEWLVMKIEHHSNILLGEIYPRNRLLTSEISIINSKYKINRAITSASINKLLNDNKISEDISINGIKHYQGVSKIKKLIFDIFHI